MSQQTVQIQQRRNLPMTETSYPGKTLGITAMVLSFLGIIIAPTAIVGLILGYMAQVQAREVGAKNIYATIAVITGWVVVGLGFLALLIFSLIFFGILAIAGV